MKRLAENAEEVVSTFGKKRPRNSEGSESVEPRNNEGSENTFEQLHLPQSETVMIHFAHPHEDTSLNFQANNQDSFEVNSYDFCASLSLSLRKIFQVIHGDGYHLGKLPECYDIYQFISRVFIETDMEFSCGIISLIYIFRAYLHHFRHQTFTPFLTEENWRSIIISSCLLASKLFDDLCMTNQDFADTFEKESLTLSLINSFELMMLRLLNFNLTVTEEEYTRYANLVVVELHMFRSLDNTPKVHQTPVPDNPIVEPILKKSDSDSPPKPPSRTWWEISLPPLSWVWTE
jgi:hypothetical protein